jgi:myo-inositol 2-dehydrogenase / D-chiro-inositol 1-dehydrogenase
MFRGTHINQGHPGTMTAHRCITQSMVHDIHSARFLTGHEIVDVFARTVPMAHDPAVVRIVTLSATFDDGSTALIDVNMAAGYGYEVSAEITGEHGTATTAMAGALTVRLAGNAQTDVTPSWRERFSDAYRTELDAWLRSVRSGVPDGPGSWDGYVSNVVADAAVRSVETGKPVPVILRDRLRA